MKIYVATRLANVEAARSINRALIAAGHEITYDWTDHPEATKTDEHMEAVSVKELDGVRAAEFVVAILPGGRGTHAEIGAALVLGKPVLIVGQKSAFMEGGYPCAFHHHPGARREVIGVRDLSLITALALKHAGAIEASKRVGVA